MAYVMKVENTSAAPEQLVAVGIRVRKDCPRNTIDVPIKYKTYHYRNGNPVTQKVSSVEIDKGGKSHTITKEIHAFDEDFKVYAFSKRGGKQENIGGRVTVQTVAQPLRFMSFPASVVQAL